MSVAPDSLITGAGPGGGPHVKAFDGVGGETGFFAYDSGFSGGVSVAAGDVNGDGTTDIITAAGPGGGPHVKVISGVNFLLLKSFFAYDPGFSGGVTVAAGDVNGDGTVDIITGAGAGAGPHVKVFSGIDLSELASFYAFDPRFAGGVSVAAGDLNGDGRADIIAGAGAGGGPHVRAFSGSNLTELKSFFAFNPAFTGGVSVAADDVNGDGTADIITGAGPGGGPHVRAFSGIDHAELASFFAYDPLFTGGVAVGAGDLNGDGSADIITGAGPGGGPHVRAFRASDRVELASFFAYDPRFTGGVLVSGAALRRDVFPPAITVSLDNDTGFSATDRLTADATVVGTVTDNGGLVAFRAGFDATTAANFVDVLADRQADGTFTITPARLNEINGAALADGPHSLHLQARDLAGNVRSVDVPFTLDTTAPTTPTFDLLAASDTGVIGDQRTEQEIVTLSGTTDAGMPVAALQTGNTTTAQGNGSLLMSGVALRLGDNPLTLRVVDAAGNRSTFTQTIVRVPAAETLNDRALAAYESVLNNVEFVTYRGSQKGAQATAETLAGNDWDQAALLIERLTDAGVNARYASGRISARIDRVMEWLGVIDPGSALTVLINAGLNAVSDLPAFAFVFDHTWVEAELVVPGSGLSWVPLDPSWKFKDRQPGIQGLLHQVPFDEAGYLSRVRTDSAIEFYEQQVAAWVHANRPGFSLADVPHDGPPIQQHLDAVPTTLPYNVVGTPSRFTDVPAAMKQRARLTLKDGDTTLWTQTFVLPEMCLDRLTLGFLGGTEVFPVVYQNGTVIFVGTEVFYAQPLDLTIESFEPGDSVVDETAGTQLRARGLYALGLDVQQHSPASLARLQDFANQVAFKYINGEPLVADERLGGVLALAIASYFYDVQREGDMLRGLTGYADVYTGLGFGTTRGEGVSFHADLPIPLIPGAAVIDVDMLSSSLGVPIDFDFTAGARAAKLRGINGSALEHMLWDNLINSPGISTIRSFQIANHFGIPIFTITSSNKDTLFPQLTLSQFDLDFLSEQIDAGATVTVPRDPTPLNDFRGVGFIVTGGTFNGYLISGILVPEEPMLQHGGIATSHVGPAPDVDPGTPNPFQFDISDPVNIANGNVSHDQTDVSLPGSGLNLQFARHYDSQSTVNMGMGLGWSFSFGDFLSFGGVDGPITWHTPQGYRYTFTPIEGEDAFVTPSALHGEFTAIAGGFRYRDKTGDTHTFDSTGRLTERRDRNGNGQLLTYDGGTGRLSMVSDLSDAARHLSFTFTGGLLSKVQDFTGREWFYAYSDGRLSQVVGTFLNTSGSSRTRYEYYTDSARDGLLHNIIALDGGVTSFDYYPNRRAFRQIDPDGGATTLYYNLARQLTTVVDQRGNSEIHQYNLAGNRIGLIRTDGAREEFTWADNLQTAEIDAFGRTKSFTYDAAGNVTNIVERDGVGTSFTYEPLFNNVTSVTRGGGQVSTFSYDANGNLTQVEDPLGGRTTFTHDARGQVLTQTDPVGNQSPAAGDHRTTLTYNTAGQVLSRGTDLPSLETFTYDVFGNPASVTDANGQTTTLVYDTRNRLLRVISPLTGIMSTFLYDGMSNLIRSTDPLSRVAHFAYDLEQNLIRQTNPDLSVITTTYDLADNVVSQTNELGHTTHFQHDVRNRQVAAYLPDGTSTHADHDAAGQIVRVEDALGNTTRFAYDAVGRPIATVDAANGTSSRTYDAVGNLLSLTDPLGHGAQFTYDLLDRQITSTDALGGTTSFAYDRNGRLVGLTDSAGNESTFGYDVRDRLVAETDALGHTRHLAYDAVGNLTRLTDRNGRVRTFAYDTLNRRTSERWLDAASDVIRTISYAYDLASQLRSSADPDSALSITYTVRGDVASVSNAGTPAVPSVVLSYAYDAGRNLISATDTIAGLPGALTAYVYDKLNQMVRILQSGSEVQDKRADFSYNAVGQFDEIVRSAILPGSGGVRTTYGYDALNRLTDLDHGRGANLLAFETLTYDAASRITSLVNVEGSSTYAYDNRGQLLSADHTFDFNSDESYSYDANGNRIASSRHGSGYVTGPGNRLLSDGTFDYLYDAEGNLIRRTETATGAVREFQWDYRNRLIAVIDKHPAGVEIQRVTYAYDTFDRRILKTVDTSPLDAVPGATTSLVYDRANVLLEFLDADGAGPDVPQQSMRYLHGPAVDQVLVQEDAEGDVLWLLADHLGTTRDLVDNAGTLRNHLSYDSFGNVVLQTDADFPTRYQFTGREFDAETGLYYYRARYYDAALGRFLSEDPLGFAAGDANLFRYVGNEPVGHTDPSGTQANTPINTDQGELYLTDEELAIHTLTSVGMRPGLEQIYRERRQDEDQRRTKAADEDRRRQKSCEERRADQPVKQRQNTRTVYDLLAEQATRGRQTLIRTTLESRSSGLVSTATVEAADELISGSDPLGVRDLIVPMLMPSSGATSTTTPSTLP